MVTKKRIAVVILSIAVIVIALFIGVRANNSKQEQEVLFGGTFVQNEPEKSETMPAFYSESTSSFCENTDTSDCFKRLEGINAFL